MSCTPGLDKVSPTSSKPERSLTHSIFAVDAAAALAAKAVGHKLDPVAAKRLLAKIDRNILPLMMVLYAMQFIDKTTLGNSSILGIKTDTHLTTTQYNLLGSLFYIAYLAFEWPQNWALQRFPVGKWMVSFLRLLRKKNNAQSSKLIPFAVC